MHEERLTRRELFLDPQGEVVVHLRQAQGGVAEQDEHLQVLLPLRRLGDARVAIDAVEQAITDEIDLPRRHPAQSGQPALADPAGRSLGQRT